MSSSPVSTTIEWRYAPDSFFEEPFVQKDTAWELKFDNGLATAKLYPPADPLPGGLLELIEQRLRGVLDCRQVVLHRKYSLGCATVTQYYHDGHRQVSAQIKGMACVVLSDCRADMTLTDAAGRVVVDTRRARIDGDTAFINRVAPAMGRNSILRGLTKSYTAAVADPANEFVHLYEITERLVTHFGREAVVFQTLTFPKAKWKRLRQLANHEPIRQGRHRGKHGPTPREATKAELEEARQIARDIIYKFAETV